MSLQRFILKRVLVMIPVLFGVTLITFSLVHLLPGDPITFMLGEAAVGEEVREEMRREYNLHLPMWEQYILWLQDAMFLNFGESIVTGRDVGEQVSTRLPATILLGLAAWLITMVIAIPTGIIAAVRKDEAADEASRFVALAGVAMPNFWLGLILMLIFAVNLGWFTVLPPTDQGLLTPEMLWFLILPAIALGTASTAILMRLMRSSMIEELNKDYIMFARAKGLPERKIILKHALRNSLISVVTIAALQIAFIVDGAVVIEEVFAWPGLGRLLVDSITRRDFPIIQALVLLIGVTIVLANLVADIVYAWLDPRIRY